MVFIRALSGHSKALDATAEKHVAPSPTDYQQHEAYAVHGATIRALKSIYDSGLKPGGARSSRAETHFLPEPDLYGCSPRKSSEVLILVDPAHLESKNIRKGKNGYILRRDDIPSTEFIAVWDMTRSTWYDGPSTS